MRTADIVLNLWIFLVTLVLVTGFFRQDGKWDPERGRKAFRFFTTQSNVLCAAAALATALAQLSGGLPRWVWTLKYIGTAALTVTMMTVFVYLWPLFGKGGLKSLLKGFELWLHLLTPLAAILSFCLLEKQGMSFAESLWGLLPLALYGPLYLYKTVYAPEEKRWDDFYSFNKQGKWPAAFALMMAGGLLICLAFMAAQNA